MHVTCVAATVQLPDDSVVLVSTSSSKSARKATWSGRIGAATCAEEAATATTSRSSCESGFVSTAELIALVEIVRVHGGAAAEALHALGAHRQHAVLMLQHSVHQQERLAHHQLTLAVEQIGPDDHVGDAGLVLERQRQVVVRQPFLLVDGVLQHQDGVLSVRAERVEGFSGGAAVDAHDFY